MATPIRSAPKKRAPRAFDPETWGQKNALREHETKRGKMLVSINKLVREGVKLSGAKTEDAEKKIAGVIYFAIFAARVPRSLERAKRYQRKATPLGRDFFKSLRENARQMVAESDGDEIQEVGSE